MHGRCETCRSASRAVLMELVLDLARTDTRKRSGTRGRTAVLRETPDDRPARHVVAVVPGVVQFSHGGGARRARLGKPATARQWRRVEAENLVGAWKGVPAATHEHNCALRHEKPDLGERDRPPFVWGGNRNWLGSRGNGDRTALDRGIRAPHRRGRTRATGEERRTHEPSCNDFASVLVGGRRDQPSDGSAACSRTGRSAAAPHLLSTWCTTSGTDDTSAGGNTCARTCASTGVWADTRARPCGRGERLVVVRDGLRRCGGSPSAATCARPGTALAGRGASATRAVASAAEQPVRLDRSAASV